MRQTNTFVIRRSFVAPLGLLFVMTIALLVVCIVQEQPLAKVVLLAVVLLPMLVLLAENAMRRIVIDSEGVTAFRPFRQRRVLFADVTGLETVQVRNRVFLTLEAGPDDFLIISNAYGKFPFLLKGLISAIPEGAVTVETQQLAQQPPRRQADTFTVWFAVLAMAYVLISQFKG